MPLKGFRCPQGSPTFGQTNSIEHCLGSCPHQCASPALLASIYRLDTENYHTGTYISASMLSGSGCPRRTVLERTHDFHEFPVKRFYGFRGTIAHSIVEQSIEAIDKYGWMSEMRMLTSFTYPDLPKPIFDAAGVFTEEYDDSQPLVIDVGGTCDSYNPVMEALWDMKTMADRKAEMMVTGAKSGEFSPHLEDSWVKQLNIYRLLIARTPMPSSVKKRFKLKGDFLPAPTFLGIQGISMMNIPRTGAAYAMKLPKRGMNIFEVGQVPVWPLEETEEFVRAEALRWYRWLVLGQPTPVVPKSKKWLCEGCSFNGERLAEGICFPDQERSETLTLED